MKENKRDNISEEEYKIKREIRKQLENEKPKRSKKRKT